MERGRSRLRIVASGLAGLLLVGLGAASQAAGSEATHPLRLARASLHVAGGQIVWRARTVTDWRGPTPAAPGRSLCLELSTPALRHRKAQVCLSRRPSGRLGLVLTPLAPSGRAHRMRARIERPDARSLVARFAPRSADLPPGVVRWRAMSTWSPRHACPRTAPLRHGLCISWAPVGGYAKLQVPPPAPRGCQPTPPSFRISGPTHPRAIALTFDDGPGPDTPAVLAALERAQAPATFFIVGLHVAGHAADLRRALADGDALGDHTFHHARVDAAGPTAEHELGSTRDLIAAVTGYSPCLFRAPYGSTSPALIALAARLGMATIQWNVDPRDWSLPGTPAIVERVLAGARPGGIVIMHDGGGRRTQTAAAIPQIVAGLRARGYRLETVPELLGFRAVR